MKISVFGLGKLGTVLAAVLAEAGHEVIGVDPIFDVRDSIARGVSPYKEPGLDELLKRVSITTTSDGESAVRDTDVSFVIVPTPSVYGRFSNNHVLTACRSIVDGMRKKDTVHTTVITSTVMPDSCDGPITEVLATAYKPFNLCYSPEFIALGSVIRDMKNPDMVLIGESCEEAGDILEEIVQSYILTDAPVRRMNLVNAEIAKIAVNTYVTMKISYANMLAEVCERFTDGDAAVVAGAIGHDSRIGTKCLIPATGFGGPCFPRDAHAFWCMAEDLGITAELAEATQSINNRQPRRLLGKVMAYHPKRVAILGLSYKPNTPITEESVGTKLYDALLKTGTDVLAYDPIADYSFNNTLSLDEILKECDVAVICTPHAEFASIDFTGLSVIDCWAIASSGNIERIGAG